MMISLRFALAGLFIAATPVAAQQALIVVDDFHFAKTKFRSAIAEVVLALSALVIIANLIVSRLPHVNPCVAIEMLLCDLVIHLHRSLCLCVGDCLACHWRLGRSSPRWQPDTRVAVSLRVAARCLVSRS